MATNASTVPTSHLKITRGPGKFDLMMGLFGGKQLSFKLGDAYLSAIVSSVRAEDSSRESWIIVVHIVGRSVNASRRWYYNTHTREGHEMNLITTLPFHSPHSRRITRGRQLRTTPTCMQFMSCMYDGQSIVLTLDGRETQARVVSLNAEDGGRKIWFATIQIAGETKPSRWYCNTSTSSGYEMITA